MAYQQFSYLVVHESPRKLVNMKNPRLSSQRFQFRRSWSKPENLTFNIFLGDADAAGARTIRHGFDEMTVC